MNFVQVGGRIVNLSLVSLAERHARTRPHADARQAATAAGLARRQAQVDAGLAEFGL